MKTAQQLSPAALVGAYLKQVKKADNWIFGSEPRQFEAGVAILDAPREERIPLLLEALRQLTQASDRNWQYSFILKPLVSAILRKKLPFTSETMKQFIVSVGKAPHGLAYHLPVAGILGAVEDYVKATGDLSSLRGGLKGLRALLRKWQDESASFRKLARRLDTLLEANGKPATGVQLTTGEKWTLALQKALPSRDKPLRASWDALLTHCATATSSQPSQKWLRAAEALVESVSPAAVAAALVPVLGQVGKAGTPPKFHIYGHTFDGDATQVHDTHSDLLRGLVWCASLAADDDLIRAVGDAAEVCFKKIPGVGPRSPKIGNACLWALSNVESPAAVARLSRLKTRVKHVSIRKQLGRALDRAAAKAGMSVDDLEETATPTCGLTAVGESRRKLGDVTALLTVADTRRAELTWIKADGTRQATAPASVRSASAGDVRELEKAVGEVAKLLPVQRDRVEASILRQRHWFFRDFRPRYLEHPLVGTIGRRLLWHFESGKRQADAIWHDGRLVDVRGKALSWLRDDTRVTLWHPLNASVDDVLAWRTWLEKHEVRQPFKQAHREIYVLTDAERATAVYSNRFAAHILRQQQFAALCHERGWRYTLQGAWDSHNTPTLELPQWDLRAEFWVDAENTDEAGTTDTGVYQFVATDHVRFFRPGADDAVDLAEVPPLVFSEVMRDVDLFVGVTSVGNDPTWADHGTEGHFLEYWNRSAFGDLTVSARTRKDVLERLVPRLSLRIADRCTVADRFLVVRGDLRTYKIHLGSANILMEPNDQYLCVVPRHGGEDKVYLPFEGDTILAVILSKAFLLAEDRKIKDATIVSQIKRR